MMIHKVIYDICMSRSQTFHSLFQTLLVLLRWCVDWTCFWRTLVVKRLVLNTNLYLHRCLRSTQSAEPECGRIVLTWHADVIGWLAYIARYLWHLHPKESEEWRLWCHCCCQDTVMQLLHSPVIGSNPMQLTWMWEKDLPNQSCNGRLEHWPCRFLQSLIRCIGIGCRGSGNSCSSYHQCHGGLDRGCRLFAAALAGEWTKGQFSPRLQAPVGKTNTQRWT